MKYLFYLVLAVLLLSCERKARESKARRLPYYDTPDFTPKWEVGNGADFHRIRPFTLVNQHNETFTEKDLAGKICVADFFFTSCPGICPKMTKSMADIQREFADDDAVLLLSHSVTPEQDSAAVLQQYAQDKKVQFGRWKLLTGEKKEIYNLGRKYYFVEDDQGIAKGDDVFLHTENFILLDPQRHIRGIYNGLDPGSIQQLISDIRVLKAE